MANLITTWRQALQALIASELQNGAFTVIPGRRDGESKDRKLACVFPAPMSEWPRDVNFRRPVMIIRAWLPKPKLRNESAPPDPEPVEELMEDLAALLEPVRASLVDPELMYYEVADAEIEYDDWGVELRLVAYAKKPVAA